MRRAGSLYTGSHELSLAMLAGRLVDLGQGSLRGLRVDLEGFETVIQELKQSVPHYGKDAGVPQDVYEHFVECNDTIAQIDKVLPLAKKLVEVLIETRALLVDARQNDISLIVDVVRGRARRLGKPEILAAFEKTIRYSGQLAIKAMKTRRRNAHAEADAELEAAAEAQTAS